MNEVTQILSELSEGNRQNAASLLPLVYDELRRLANQKMAMEVPGQTLSATGLVHEAFLRLVGRSDEARWESRVHFFRVAAEAMRRILIDRAARNKRSNVVGNADASNSLTKSWPKASNSANSSNWTRRCRNWSKRIPVSPNSSSCGSLSD